VALEESMASWPLWPDVEAFLSAPHPFACGILSNVDEALFDATPVAPLVDRSLVLTSELLGAYKPSPELYGRAAERTPDWVHVASSARDVRGALEAGVRTVRLARPGHLVDAAGPAPAVTVDTLDAIEEAVLQVHRRPR
jgi:2-haloacid dehalogenase